MGGNPLHQDGFPVYQAHYGQPGRGLRPLPRRQRLARVEEQDDGQGQTRRDEPLRDGVRHRRRAHLRLLGTVDGSERQDQGRPPEARRVAGHEKPLHRGRRRLCGRQLPDLEGVPRQDDLQRTGRRPPHPARRQRQGLHGKDHDRPEPQEAQGRLQLRLRLRDRGLLPEHRH
ncbi:hypothetical protein SDC9_133429 [bioreactor metagenome]|uniref:Uncharacterized protein n=1 Tax=bioreactor metagenome TaxID=1076179 RepID=A0A645D9Y7_9ZZZZ